MTTRERCINWGLYVGGKTTPDSYPPISPMFKNAPMRKWYEEGWGDEEGAPEEIPPPIDEKDAQYLETLIRTIKSERLKLALLIEYACAPRSFRFRHYGYTESVDEALRLLDDMLTGQSKKAQILRLLSEREKSGRVIAEIVGVSEAYVCQLKCAA